MGRLGAMPLTLFLPVNLPENGTEAGGRLTLCQNGTEPPARVKVGIQLHGNSPLTLLQLSSAEGRLGR